MAEVRSAPSTCYDVSQTAVRLAGIKPPIQTQLIDSRYVRDPTHLVLLLNDEYGSGNYEVEVGKIRQTPYLFPISC